MPEVVLSVQVKTPIIQQGASGLRVELTFDLEHQAAVEEAAGKVFQVGHRGLRLFVQGPPRAAEALHPLVPPPVSADQKKSLPQKSHSPDP